MILTETRVIQCYCDECGNGMVTMLLDKSFAEKKQLSDYVNEKLICDECGKETILEEIYYMIPENFRVYSNSDKPKMKNNDGIKKFFDS